MTHKQTIDAVRLSLLLADTRSDRRLGIPRAAKHIPLPVPAPVPSSAPALAHRYALPLVVPTPLNDAGFDGWGW